MKRKDTATAKMLRRQGKLERPKDTEEEEGQETPVGTEAEKDEGKEAGKDEETGA